MTVQHARPCGAPISLPLSAAAAVICLPPSVDGASDRSHLFAVLQQRLFNADGMDVERVELLGDMAPGASSHQPSPSIGRMVEATSIRDSLFPPTLWTSPESPTLLPGPLVEG
eukprot:CAMPEP_0198124984 /NCGR_PEP_ID=MMETSP1442-20131203/41492_1 /TAXON_ID= /ORGANISM="Craspedostauros australis, Strain CCMP3328" /LENGTH=112 /DNA_ID=CAMNT_0043784503 /DNA_START=299 /DNA_END=634 /DNA_ORIENTATION=+